MLMALLLVTTGRQLSGQPTSQLFHEQAQPQLSLAPSDGGKGS